MSERGILRGLTAEGGLPAHPEGVRDSARCRPRLVGAAEGPLSPWWGGTEEVESTPQCLPRAVSHLYTQTVCLSVAAPDQRLRPNRTQAPPLNRPHPIGGPAHSRPYSSISPAGLWLSDTKSQRNSPRGLLAQLSCEREMPLRRAPANSWGNFVLRCLSDSRELEQN